MKTATVREGHGDSAPTASANGYTWSNAIKTAERRLVNRIGTDRGIGLRWTLVEDGRELGDDETAEVLLAVSDA